MRTKLYHVAQRRRLRQRTSPHRETEFRHLVASVNRTPTHTACADAHSVSGHHTAQSDHFSSREHAWLKIASLRVPKIVLSSTRHISLLAAPDTDHRHKFSLTCLSNLKVILSYTPKPVVSRSIHIYTAHGRVAVPRISHLPQ